MWIFLPVAGISLPLLALVGVGAAVGFLSGMVGVSGGFVLTPILMLMGVPPTVAAASGSCEIVAGSSSGAAAHFRLGNVDVKLGLVLLTGGLAGAAVGVRIIRILRALDRADFVITVTYVVVLAVIGIYMFRESVQSLRRGTRPPVSDRAPAAAGFLRRLPLQMDFPRSHVQHSVLVPFALCAMVGILAAIMGVGGGFIMVPLMVYVLRMPMHKAVGTDLFQILFTSAGVTFLQAVTNHTVDLMLALLLAMGSTVGAQIGARLGRRLRGDQLKFLLASMVLVVMVKMALGLVMTPALRITPAGVHRP